MNAYVHASVKDDLVTCIRELKAGELVQVEGKEIKVIEGIPIYHKMAIKEIKQGQPVHKYGEVMGVASQDIQPGQWAHIHNIDSTRGRGDVGCKED